MLSVYLDRRQTSDEEWQVGSLDTGPSLTQPKQQGDVYRKKTLLNEQANCFAPCKETSLKEDGPDLEKQLLAGKRRPRREKVGRLKVDGGKVTWEGSSGTEWGGYIFSTGLEWQRTSSGNQLH